MQRTTKSGRFAKIAKYALATATLSASLTASAVTVAPYFFAWSFGDTTHYKVGTLMDSHTKAGVNAMTLAFGVSNGGCTLGGGLDETLSELRHSRRTSSSSSPPVARSSCPSAVLTAHTWKQLARLRQ